jgi:transcriptional regulator with XRE-family HTH domain
MKTSSKPKTGQKPAPFRVYTPETLGAALRHYRQSQGISQAKLAELTGLNRTYLSALEQGRETTQLRRLFRVLRQLGIRVSLDQADW